MSSAASALKGQLNLIDEADIIATSQLKKRCVYHSVDWEVGMSVAGSDGDLTPHPYVNLVFKGVDEKGNINTYPVSYSLQHFYDFVQNVQRMQKSISSFK